MATEDKSIPEVPHLENITGVEKIPVSAVGGLPRYVEVNQIVEKVEKDGVEASKLKNPVTLWGQEFDGSKDVTGGISFGDVEEKQRYIEGVQKIRLYCPFKIDHYTDTLFFTGAVQGDEDEAHIGIAGNYDEEHNVALRGSTLVDGDLKVEGNTIEAPGLKYKHREEEFGDEIIFDGEKWFIFNNDWDEIISYVDGKVRICATDLPLTISAATFYGDITIRDGYKLSCEKVESERVESERVDCQWLFPRNTKEGFSIYHVDDDYGLDLNILEYRPLTGKYDDDGWLIPRILVSDTNADTVIAGKEIKIEAPHIKIGERYGDSSSTVEVEGNITSDNIKEMEAKLEGVTKAADNSEVVKGIRVGNNTIKGNVELLGYGGINIGYGGSGFSFSADTSYLATKASVDDLKQSVELLVNGETANDAFDTLKEVDTWIKEHEGEAANIVSDINELRKNQEEDLAKITEVQGKLNGVTQAQERLKGHYISDVTNSGGSINVTQKSYYDGVESSTSIDFKTINGKSLFGQGDLKISGEVTKNEFDVLETTVNTLNQGLGDKEDRMPIEVVSGETLEAKVGRYYRFDEAVNTLAVTLPTIEDKTRAKVLEIFFTIGDNPQVTFNGGSAAVKYFSGFALKPNTTYELNLMFNGENWIVAYATVE